MEPVLPPLQPNRSTKTGNDVESGCHCSPGEIRQIAASPFEGSG
jgi:hypothetical protein